MRVKRDKKNHPFSMWRAQYSLELGRPFRVDCARPVVDIIVISWEFEFSGKDFHDGEGFVCLYVVSEDVFEVACGDGVGGWLDGDLVLPDYPGYFGPGDEVG